MRRTIALSRAIWVIALATMITGESSAQTESDQRAKEASGVPGVELSRTVAQATGIAISPLLGVAAVGGWRYVHAAEVERGVLPWFCSPWFWVPSLGVALLLISKDFLLVFAPFVKTPLNALEMFENKASALVATPVIIPMFLEAFGRSEPAPPEVLAAGFAGLGTAPVVVLLPVYLGSLAAVWLLGHALRVLILVSPFGVLDLVLRSTQLLVIGIIAVATFLHPYLGAAIALIVILVAGRLAGWAFRLVVFGTLTAWDLLSLASRRTDVGTGPVWGFALRRFPGVATRTFGIVKTAPNGGMAFVHRPWLVLPRRSVPLPPGDYVLGKGFLAPSILLKQRESAPTPLVMLCCRYRTHEMRLQELLDLQQIEETSFRRGLRQAWAFLREFAGRGIGVVEDVGRRVAVSSGRDRDCSG